MLLRAVVLSCVAAFVSAQDPPPPLGDHLEPTSAIDREHVHHAGIEGSVLDADGKPVAGARVYLYGFTPWWGPRPMAAGTADAEGRYRIDDITVAGSLALHATTPRGVPFACGWWSLGLASGQVSKLRPVTLSKPVERASAHTFRGRLVGAGGQPLAGATWQLHHERGFDAGAFATTDGDGKFEVHSDLGVPKGGVLFVGDVRFRLEHEGGASKLGGTAGMMESGLDLVAEGTIEVPSVAVVPLPTCDIDGATFFQSRGEQFAPCIAGSAFAYTSSGGESETVWVRAPGRLPRSVQVPGGQLDFTADTSRSLRVVDDNGAPVAGALVDVCGAWPAARLAETTLATFLAGDDGVLTLHGPADEHVVYVYAKGFAPARARWRSGETPNVVLARCSARLVVTAGETNASLYVRPAGTFGSCAKLYPHAGENVVELVPGDYELTVYGEKRIEAAVRVVVAGDTAITMPTEDQRPELVVTIAKAAKDDACWAYASRSMVGGMITKWAIHSQRGGPMPRQELVAIVDEPDAKPDADDARRFRVRLPTSGRSTVLAGNGDLGGGGVRFFRESTFEFGRKYGIELKAPAGGLHGNVAKYPDLWEGSGAMHGIVGPRLCLEPSGSTPWGVLVALPEPAKFQFAALQPGTFTLHHHLYETGILYSDEGTWGGTPLTIATDTPGVTGELARGPDADLVVHVVDRAGKPIDGHLAIRDRMFECWTDDLRQHTTLDGAMDPIPTPPAAELADGKATLPRVRAGRLAFVLERDDGSRVHFARDVEPGKTLEVVLDVGR